MNSHSIYTRLLLHTVGIVVLFSTTCDAITQSSSTHNTETPSAFSVHTQFLSGKSDVVNVELVENINQHLNLETTIKIPDTYHLDHKAFGLEGGVSFTLNDATISSSSAHLEVSLESNQPGHLVGACVEVRHHLNVSAHEHTSLFFSLGAEYSREHTIEVETKFRSFERGHLNVGFSPKAEIGVLYKISESTAAYSQVLGSFHDLYVGLAVHITDW